MAKPPAGSSLLFGALADFARIKQRKNGSYRMVLRGIDQIDWFTDRPDRVAGEWSPKKFVRKWNRLFGDVEPNAQATFSAPLREEYENTELNYITTSVVGSKRELVTFEMFKPKLNDLRGKLSFKIRGIGKKNKDLLTGLRGKQLSDASLFIDDGTTEETTATMKVWNNSGLNMQMRSLSDNAVFGNPSEVSGYTDAELDEGDIFFTGGEEGAEGIFELPVTLKNGLQEPPVDVDIEPMPFGGGLIGQCNENEMAEEYGLNGPTTVYYSINGGATQSVEATCEMMM